MKHGTFTAFPSVVGSLVMLPPPIQMWEKTARSRLTAVEMGTVLYFVVFNGEMGRIQLLCHGAHFMLFDEYLSSMNKAFDWKLDAVVGSVSKRSSLMLCLHCLSFYHFNVLAEK